MSTAAPRDARCAPRFPADGALLDNCVLVRFWKCDALDALADSVPLFAASHVVKEFQRQGREERAALARLGVKPLSVRLGTREWELFGELRGGDSGRVTSAKTSPSPSRSRTPSEGSGSPS